MGKSAFEGKWVGFGIGKWLSGGSQGVPACVHDGMLGGYGNANDR